MLHKCYFNAVFLKLLYTKCTLTVTIINSGIVIIKITQETLSWNVKMEKGSSRSNKFQRLVPKRDIQGILIQFLEIVF